MESNEINVDNLKDKDSIIHKYNQKNQIDLDITKNNQYHEEWKIILYPKQNIITNIEKQHSFHNKLYLEIGLIDTSIYSFHESQRIGIINRPIFT